MSLLSATLLNQVKQLACEAGELILSVYQREFKVAEKADSSPLTEADLLAHQHILAGLSKLTPALPILSEEAADIPWQTRQNWSEYWLVDPLDGTKEFIKQNGEFTVNIALISAGVPVLGVVYAPALQQLYFAAQGMGAYRSSQQAEPIQIAVKPRLPDEIWRVVGSRSHASQQTQDYLSQLGGEHQLVAMGSSLKICLVAEGTAHLYPRLGPTSEWDTAAAHAVVLEAGGSICQLDGQPLRYNQKPSLKNPHFVVR